MKKSKQKGRKAPQGPAANVPAPEDVQRKLDLLKNLNLSIGDLKNSVKTFEKKYKENDTGVTDAWKDLEGRIEKIEEGWRKKRFKLTLIFAHASLDMMREKGVDQKNVERYLDDLSKMKEAQELDRSFEKLSSLKETFENSLEPFNDVTIPEAWSSFDKALDSFIELSGKGQKMPKAKTYFKKMISLVEKKDLDKTLVYSNLLYTATQSDLSDDMVKDRFIAIKEDISNLMATMDDFQRMGVEPEGMKIELDRLRETLDPSKYLEAQTTLTRINKSLSKIEKEFFRRKADVNLLEASDLIDEYGNLLDLSASTEKVERLKEYQTTLPSRKFLEESNSLLTDIKGTLFSNFEGQVMDRLKVLEENIDSIGGLEEEEMGSLKGLVVSVGDALSNKNITEAMELLSVAESMVGRSGDETKLMEVEGDYINFLADYELLLSDNIEIEELNEQISELEHLFLQDPIKTDRIEGILGFAQERIKGKLVEVRKNDFEQQKNEILDILGSIHLPSEKREKLVAELDRIGSTLDEVKDKDYRTRMAEIRKDIDNEVSGYFRDHYEDWAVNLQADIEALQGKGEDVSPLQYMMEDAGKCFRERDYLGSGRVLRSLNSEVDSMKREMDLKRAEEVVDSVQFLLEEASEAGVDIKAHGKELQRAKDLLSKGDIRGTIGIADEVDRRIKAEWKQKKKRSLEQDLQGLKEYLDESTSIGLDIGEASSLLKEAETLFLEERFDEVNEIVDKAKETVDLDRRAYFSDGAMESISHLKEEIADLNKMGVSTLEAETMLIEAERHFMGEDYEKAYALTLDIREQVNASREVYLNDRIPKEMDEAVKKVGKLELMGLDTETARQYLTSATHFNEEGRSVEAIGDIRKAMDIADEILKSHVSLAIPETIVDVKRQINYAMEDGMDLGDVISLLKDAEDMFKNEDYDEAMSTIEKVQGEFETRKTDFFKEQFLTNIDQVGEMMDNAVGMEAEVELSKDNINMARDAFERGDFETSHRLMDKVIRFLQKSMDDRELNRRRDVVQTYLEEVRTLIGISESEKIDVSEEKNLLGIAIELLDKGDFDQAEHILEGIKLGLNDKRMHMKRKLIESSIQTSEILLENMSNMGIDISQERSLIEEQKEALRNGELDRCDDLNKRLVESLSRNQGPYLVQKVQREIAEMRVKIAEAFQKGIEVAETQGLIGRASEMFELGDLENSQKYIIEGREALKLSTSAFKRRLFETDLEEVMSLMGSLVHLGIPVDDEETLVGMAQDSMDKERYDEGLALLETARMGAAAKKDSFQMTTAEGYISQIDTYLQALRSQSIDVTDLERIYEEGMDLHERGDDEKAVSKFSSILELGEELRNIHELDIQRSRLDTLRAKYNDIIKVGAKPSKQISNQFAQVDEMFIVDTVDINKVKQQLNVIEADLEKRAEPFMKDLAKKTISDASNMFRELSSEVQIDPMFQHRIKEASERWRLGNYKAAMEIADSVKSELEKVRVSESEVVLKDEMASVTQMLIRLKTLGSNVSNAETLLSRSKLALEEGRVEVAEQLIRSVRESVKETMRRNMRETASENIEFVDSMIHYLTDNFAGISQSLGPPEMLLEQARELFKDQKFKAAKAKADEAREAIEKMDLQNLKQFLYVFRSLQADEALRMIASRVQELSLKGLDTSKVSMLYDRAKVHVQQDEFDKGRQMVTLARIMLSEIDQQTLRDQAFDELNSTHVEILSKKKTGASVTNAYKTYTSAKEAFSAREYKKSILLSKKALYQTKRG